MRASLSAFLLSYSLLATAAPEEWRDSPRVLSCAPRVLHAGDTLRLSLGPKHGRELSVTRLADGATFMLVIGAPPQDMVQLMTPDEFAKVKSLSIPTSVEATRWDGAEVREPIFTRLGIYEVSVSEVFESERGGFYCRVHYAGAKR